MQLNVPKSYNLRLMGTYEVLLYEVLLKATGYISGTTSD